MKSTVSTKNRREAWPQTVVSSTQHKGRGSGFHKSSRKVTRPISRAAAKQSLSADVKPVAETPFVVRQLSHTFGDLDSDKLSRTHANDRGDTLVGTEDKENGTQLHDMHDETFQNGENATTTDSGSYSLQSGSITKPEEDNLAEVRRQIHPQKQTMAHAFEEQHRKGQETDVEFKSGALHLKVLQEHVLATQSSAVKSLSPLAKSNKGPVADTPSAPTPMMVGSASSHTGEEAKGVSTVVDVVGLLRHANAADWKSRLKCFQGAVDYFKRNVSPTLVAFHASNIGDTANNSSSIKVAYGRFEKICRAIVSSIPDAHHKVTLKALTVLRLLVDSTLCFRLLPQIRLFIETHFITTQMLVWHLCSLVFSGHWWKHEAAFEQSRTLFLQDCS